MTLQPWRLMGACTPPPGSMLHPWSDWQKALCLCRVKPASLLASFMLLVLWRPQNGTNFWSVWQPFWIWTAELVFLLFALKEFLYTLDTSPFIRYLICKHVLPVCSLNFHFLDNVFQILTFKNCDEVQSIFFLLRFVCFWPKNIHLTQGHKDFSYIFFLEILQF